MGRVLSKVIVPAVTVLCLAARAQEAGAQSRWTIEPDGAIAWKVQRGQAHEDHIEMSGRKVSVIVTYGAGDRGELTMRRHIVFPTLRTIPNDTHASLSYTYGEDAEPRIFIGGRAAPSEMVKQFRHRGIMTIDSAFGKAEDVVCRRTVFPSVDQPAVIERYSFTNRSAKPIPIEVESTRKLVRTDQSRGVTGAYLITSEVIDA